jgi:excisionase family DNA binding protein
MRLAYSVKETASLLGISESSVYWMCHRNELPHTRIKGRGCNGKGRILIAHKALEKWLEGGE